MSESTKAALAASVAAGYLLGRRRNTKLAMALATYLASKKLKAKPQDLLGASPQVSQLVEQLREEVLSVGRQALKAAADRRLGGFADSLADRTKSLNGILDAAGRGGDEEEEGEGGEGPSGKGSEEPEGEGRSGERPARPRRPRREDAGEAGASAERTAKTAGRSAKSAKSVAKAPAKKAPAKKAAKKSAARKPPAESAQSRR